MNTTAQQIQNLFARIANWYDAFNRIFSFGIDQSWRKKLVQCVLKHSPDKIMDLATGSGDVALMFQAKGCNVIGADFCLPLLEKAKAKGLRHICQADALALPFEDGSFDAVTIAFGFRNFTDRAQSLREIKRVLRPDGYLHILEFSKPQLWLRPFYYAYLTIIMPMVTGLWIRQKGAYDYLAKSILDFPNQNELKQYIETNGFSEVSYKNLTFGIVAIHTARKSA